MCECEAWSFVDIRVRGKERKIAREWKAARASEKERNRDATLKDTVMIVPSCISLFCKITLGNRRVISPKKTNYPSRVAYP